MAQLEVERFRIQRFVVLIRRSLLPSFFPFPCFCCWRWWCKKFQSPFHSEILIKNSQYICHYWLVKPVNIAQWRGSAIGGLRIWIRVGEPYFHTLTFCSRRTCWQNECEYEYNRVGQLAALLLVFFFSFLSSQWLHGQESKMYEYLWNATVHVLTSRPCS